MNLLYDRLFNSRDNNNVFIQYTEEKEPLTYKRFLLEIKTTARYLQNLGLKCGDRLVLQISKSHHVLTIYGACVQLGIKATGIEISQKSFDIACSRLEKTEMQKELFTYDQPSLFTDRGSQRFLEGL